jgi:hypothetical protein
MIRLAWLALLTMLPACAPMQVDKQVEKQIDKLQRGYAGTVQKVFRITRQGDDLPGIRLLGQVGSVLGPALRQSSETHQYVVRTPTGQIIVQSDDEFAVGDCVAVIPESDAASGPAFRYGQARVLKSEQCTT